MNDKKYFSAQGDAAGRLNADDAPFSIGQNEWVNRLIVVLVVLIRGSQETMKALEAQ